MWSENEFQLPINVPVHFQIITDAGLSDVYDSLINVVSRDLPTSVYVYNFLYDGKLCELKNLVSRNLETKLKGEIPSTDLNEYGYNFMRVIHHQRLCSGAFHCADGSHWNYNQELAGKNMNELRPKDRKVIDTLTNLFTTFAKTS